MRAWNQRQERVLRMPESTSMPYVWWRSASMSGQRERMLCQLRSLAWPCPCFGAGIPPSYHS